jgi:hypothetical protein
MRLAAPCGAGTERRTKEIPPQSRSKGMSFLASGLSHHAAVWKGSMVLASDAEFDRAELAPRFGDIECDIHRVVETARNVIPISAGVNTLPSLRLILCTAFHLALD